MRRTKQELIYMLADLNSSKLSDECFDAFEKNDFEKANEEVLRVSSIEDLEKITYNYYKEYIKESFEGCKNWSYEKYLNVMNDWWKNKTPMGSSKKYTNKLIHDDYKTLKNGKEAKIKYVSYKGFMSIKNYLKKEIENMK